MDKYPNFSKALLVRGDLGAVSIRWRCRLTNIGIPMLNIHNATQGNSMVLWASVMTDPDSWAGWPQICGDYVILLKPKWGAPWGTSNNESFIAGPIFRTLIRRSHDRLIFNMGNPHTRERQSLYWNGVRVWDKPFHLQIQTCGSTWILVAPRPLTPYHVTRTTPSQVWWLGWILTRPIWYRVPWVPGTAWPW